MSGLVYTEAAFLLNGLSMGMTHSFLRVSPAELEEYLADAAALEQRVFNDEGDDPRLVYIDKAWDGLIFLLTGKGFTESDAPLMNVFFSGVTFDEEQDLGYGPAHYSTPGEVKELHLLLSELSNEEVAGKYDPQKMTELDIYPGGWENEELKEYLIDYFRSVKEVYALAAENGEAIITFLS
ncbi:MAG: YfbM family protein [Flavipsychrobacter sp.]|nr:YfbM family protein [Flavipsychrobacter sp.]